jgi:molecular chaperone HtpG
VLEDEKFYERVKDFLIWKNTDQNWTTIPDYLEKNREKTQNKIFYTIDEKHVSHFLSVYRQQGIDVLCLNSSLDPYLLHFLEGKLSPVTFQRIDAEVHDTLVDKSREKTILDAEGKTEAVKLAEFIRSKLREENLDIQAKSLATDSLPGLIVMDEKERRMRDYLTSLDPKEGGQQMASFGKKTFVVNTNNSLIHSIQKLDRTHPELAKDLTKEVYELALLSQREMDPTALHEFINRSNRVLEALTTQALKTV